MALVNKALHPEELAAHSSVVEEKVFLPYQLQVIRNKILCELIEKGRQEGLSWTLAYKAKNISGEEGRENTYFSTKTRILAKQFIQDTAAWAKLSKLIKSVVDATYEDEIKVFNSTTEEEETVNTYNIRFPNRFEITALSSNADAMRGFRGYKIADEFAIHKQQKEMLDSLLPSRMWRKPLTICSTHKGIGSEFNKLIRKYKQGDLGPDWNLISIPIQRAVSEGLLEKIYKRKFSLEEKQEWLRNLEREEGPARWKQEYCCIPDDEASAFFSYDLIISAEMEDILFDPDQDIKKFTGAGQAEEAKKWFKTIAFTAHVLGKGNLYLGMDIGRDVNYTVLCLIEEIGGIKFVRAIAALEKMPFDVQQDCTRIWIRIPRFRRACVDNRGMGRETVERLQQSFGPFVVEKIDFNLALKESMAYAVLRSMTDKMLRLPAGSDTVRDDIHSIQKETTDAGNVRYVARQNDTDPNSHGDYYTAIALAEHASGGSAPPLDTIITEAGAPKISENYDDIGFSDAYRNANGLGDVIDNFHQYRL